SDEWEFESQTSDSNDLSPGTYTVPRGPYQQTPSVRWGTNYSACSRPATFTILEYGSGPDGTMTSLALDMTSGCGMSSTSDSTMAASIRFNSQVAPKVPVVVAVEGGGVVSGGPAVSCTTTCAGLVAPGYPISFSAQASNGWQFSGWSGDADCGSTFSAI